MSNEQNKHTPGPWYLADLGRGKIGIQKHEAGIISRIAVCHPEMLADEHGGSVISNAHLIFAAPDMLEALRKDVRRIEQLCDMVNSYSIKLGLGKKVHTEDWHEITRAAIAKAEGQEKP